MSTRLQSKLSLSNWRILLGSIALSAIFIMILCQFFHPRWESNDDVGMSMMAHGYGLVAIGTPNLIFSNVIWGWFVRLIPIFYGTLGYSLATLGVLFIVSTVVCYSLFKVGIGYLGTLLVLALIILRPTLLPQFTANSGLLMVSAVLCWHLYALGGDKRVLITGCLLALLSYLIRDQECLLVLLVALPLLPWKTIWLYHAPKVAIIALLTAIGVSAVIDHQAYQGEDWKYFNKFTPALRPYVDFGAVEALKQHPDILQQHGYSQNDIQLIEDWFFVDPNIANAQQLKAMLLQLGPLSMQGNALKNAWLGIKALWNVNLFAIVMAALVILVLRPGWRAIGVWGLVFAAVILLGVVGRPGVLRVYFPLTCLLLVAPFLRDQITFKYHGFISIVLLIAALLNTFEVVSQSIQRNIASKEAQKLYSTLPQSGTVIWGATLPFEALFPVLGESFLATHQLYALGGSTLAPFSYAFVEQKNGRGMIDLFTQPKGVVILAPEVYFSRLHIYCSERQEGVYHEILFNDYQGAKLKRCFCLKKNNARL